MILLATILLIASIIVASIAVFGGVSTLLILIFGGDLIVFCLIVWMLCRKRQKKDKYYINVEIKERGKD